MIRINLLPHRAEKRRRRNIQMGALAGVAAALGAVVVGLVHFAIATQIDYQGGRNGYLKKEIATLDKQIEEIKKLKEQTQQLLARKKVVETLQVNRSDVVHVLDQLARQLPDGVYLKGVKQTGNKLNLTGYAQSNARVSTLMRSLDESEWIEQPALIEIKAATVDRIRLSEFSLDITLSRPKAEAPAKPGAKPGAPAAAPAAAAGAKPAPAAPAAAPKAAPAAAPAPAPVAPPAAAPQAPAQEAKKPEPAKK